MPLVPFACMPSPLLRQVGGSCSLIIFPLVGLPQVRGGSAPASWFSRLAQRLLTLRPARLQSRLHDPFTSEASAALLPPPLLRLLPGGTNQFPGGTCTHCGLNAFSRRTRTISLTSSRSHREGDFSGGSKSTSGLAVIRPEPRNMHSQRGRVQEWARRFLRSGSHQRQNHPGVLIHSFCFQPLDYGPSKALMPIRKMHR